MFCHEKLEVYQKSVEFLKEVISVICLLFIKYCRMRRQNRRCRQKKRYYSIARGSTLKCAAIFDLLKAWNLFDQSVLKTPTSLLSSLAAMLSKLVFKSQPVSEREQVTGSGSRSRAGVFYLIYPHLFGRNLFLEYAD